MWAQSYQVKTLGSPGKVTSSSAILQLEMEAMLKERFQYWGLEVQLPNSKISQLPKSSNKKQDCHDKSTCDIPFECL